MFERGGGYRALGSGFRTQPDSGIRQRKSSKGSVRDLMYAGFDNYRFLDSAGSGLGF